MRSVVGSGLENYKRNAGRWSRRGGTVRAIALIERQAVVRQILEHLGPPPQRRASGRSPAMGSRPPWVASRVEPRASVSHGPALMNGSSIQGRIQTLATPWVRVGPLAELQGAQEVQTDQRFVSTGHIALRTVV